MNDKVKFINDSLKRSRIASAAGDYATAKMELLQACECVLLLAKAASGHDKIKYMDNYRAMKDMVSDLNAKIEALKNPAPSVSARPKDVENPSPSRIGAQKKNDPIPPRPTISGETAPLPTKEPVNFLGSLSPKRLADYIGQPKAVLAVKDLVGAALLRDAALPHIILYGSHGLGKTTFAKILANEMGASFTEVNAQNITINELVSVLRRLNRNDILFIDEIHTLPTQVAEAVMYSAMQDGKITYTESKGKDAHPVTVTLQPFTLIGATTEIGKIAKPFTQRAIQIRLEEYTVEVLAQIIGSSFIKLGVKAASDVCLRIAERCRNNPRVANNMVKRISDKALLSYAIEHNIHEKGFLNDVEKIRKLNISITEEIVNKFFEESGIDRYGLEPGDRQLLEIIIKKFGGGPVGLNTLARAMNEAENVITQNYEAYLIKRGMLKVEREGRVAMPAGYVALNMPVPDMAKEHEENSKREEPQKRTGQYDKQFVTVAKTPVKSKCDAVEELIVYPEGAVVGDDPLDRFFTDVDKPYDDVTAHACELEVDFGDRKRLLLCDSFLERKFAIALAKVGYIKDIKAQSLELPYISQRLANRKYFPDFMIRDYKGRIAIIEMKNFDAACYHLNIDKYEQLAQYCKEHGYGYAEVMKPYNSEKYISIEMLARKTPNKELEQFIISKIESRASEEEAYFTNADLDEYSEKFGPVDRTEIYTILLNNRKLRNIDRYGPDVKITLS